MRRLLNDPNPGTLCGFHIQPRFASINVPRLGTIILAEDVELCDRVMRLIGRPLLLQLADDAGEHLQGSARALAAEITSADWKSPGALQRAFPKARIEKRRVFVDLDERHCAVIIVNYKRSVAMVEYAGANAGYGKVQPSSFGKAGWRK